MDQLSLPDQATATAKQLLNPPCAVFSDTISPLPASTSPTAAAPPPLNLRPSSASSASSSPTDQSPLSSTTRPNYDYFRWRPHAVDPPPDLSAAAPIAAIADDHSGAHPAAAAGAWYAFARGLHTPVGAALFPDHAAAASRPRRPRAANASASDDDAPHSPSAADDDSPGRAGASGASSPGSTPGPRDAPSGRPARARGRGGGGGGWDRSHTPCIVPTLHAAPPGGGGGGGGSGAGHGEPGGATGADEITAEQVANGADVQGIPWDTLPFSRTDYRATRMSEQSRNEAQDYTEGLKHLLREPRRGAQFFDFFKSSRRVKCSIVHFQLRNLAWATSNHDVYVMHEAKVVHWDSVAKRKTQVLDLSGTGTSLTSGLGMVQISTMIAKEDLVIAGGFYGEMVAKNMRTGTIMHDKRITYDENAITNAIDIFDDTIMTSNNDCHVRCFDMETFARKSSFQFNSPVNHATRQPGGKMVAVAGDSNPIQVLDGDSGEQIAQLHGHGHYSFATGWHPGGRMFATGSQDKTCRVWDVRNMSQSFAVLGAHIGAVRSLRFSACGKFMVMAEPRDFVHIFDVNGGEFDTCQEIDLFGEIAGIAMTPCAEGLYVAVSDRLYSSLIEYERRDSSSLTDLFY